VDFKGKTVFITGAGGGIGQASACAFAEAGANIILTDTDQKSLSRTEAMVRERGAVAASMVLDVTDRPAVMEAVQATVNQFGSLDSALNNAGIYPTQAELAKVDEEIARRVMEINYWGTFHCMQAQIEAMLRQGGGTIVNVSSGAGLIGFPLSSAYCASKHAVVGLTKSAAIDYAARNVRINCICPGVIETKMVDALLAGNEAKAAITAGHPIGRIGQPSEIADAALWLSSPRSSFVVGASISVDGGFTAQ
jgi:NAD(P)-dependent dehydrogenase (short-subunit alcohol dehydrogenase family)